MVARLRSLQRRIELLQQEEALLARQATARVDHLQELYGIPSLADVKYEEWSKVRLDRLLVDYLLRMGYERSARALAREQGITDLVDLEVFAHCHQIADSLKRGSTAEALAWCAEHKALMKKSNVRYPPSYDGSSVTDDHSRSTLWSSSSVFRNTLNSDAMSAYWRPCSTRRSI